MDGKSPNLDLDTKQRIMLSLIGETESINIDWDSCIICQHQSNEALKCPLKGPGDGDKSGPYQSFLTRVSLFQELELLPMPLSHITDHTAVDDLVAHEAKWHKSCHNKLSNDKLERAKKRKRANNDDEASVAKRICPRRSSLEKNICIFCEEENGKLHQFSTLQSDKSIRMMATDLQDVSLLARIEGGDLIALEAKYHINCLTELRNRHRSLVRESNYTSSDLHEEEQMKARAFVELLAYIENSVEDGSFFFKLYELRHLYENRLE